MEGYLKKYKNFMSGYKKCYLKLDGEHLSIAKGDSDADQKILIDLAHCKIETSVTASRDFTLCFYLPESQKNSQQSVERTHKQKKVFFQAKDTREKKEWVNAL